MPFIHFDAIDEQGNKERDIYVNPQQVRAVTSLPPYGKRERARIAFSADDSLLVSGTADGVRRKLDGEILPEPAQAPPPASAAAK
jgi:hypothetical protein